MTYTTHKSILLRLALCAGSVVFAWSLPAQTTATWLPLQVGNSWLYRPAPGRIATGEEARTISVQSIDKINGRDYFNVSWFGRVVKLRPETGGSIVEYDPSSSAERPWLSLGLPVGNTFPTAIDRCAATGRIVARDARVTGPAGTFANVVHVGFQGPCADAGPTSQFYAPEIGLVRAEETSFAGPVVFELVYFRTASAAGSGPEISFSMGLSAPRYAAGDTLRARLTLRSTSLDPIHLTFPSGQSFDFKIYSEKGDIGYTWSANKLFPMIFREETFGPGEHTYGLDAPLGNLPPGRYTAEGFLTTQPLMYLARVSFEIVAGQVLPASGNFARTVAKRPR
jgi:hypothetical protein